MPSLITKEDDRKRAAVAIVSPDKGSTKRARKTGPSSPKNKENEDEEYTGGFITAASIMGFPSHPNTTNGDIMKNEYGFVLWMRKKKKDGELFSGRMTDFIDWVESPEGKTLETETLQQRRSVEIEEQGKETFNFGKHKGKTFAQIAIDDPEYHSRYMYMLHGEAPLPVLARYISWFEKSSDMRDQSSPARTREDQSLHNQKFTFGKHYGQTFQQVAREDPSYHLRCRETGYSLRCPDTTCMNKYIRYFRRYGDQLAAVRGERDAIKSALVGMGIYPDCDCFD
eukprot:824022_1